MKVVDFNEMKATKEGKITPKAILESALRWVDDKEQVVIITLDKEGEVKTGWSSGSLLQLLGLIEAGKMNVLEQLYEEED